MSKPTIKQIFYILADRYAGITLKEIQEAADSIKDLTTQMKFEPYGAIVARKLTGFASEDCTLCQSVALNSCEPCYWTITTDTYCADHQTYINIKDAKDKYELKDAMKARSDYMHSVNRRVKSKGYNKKH